ncbi:21190_t:CDS:2, partial [Racocetra persica]
MALDKKKVGEISEVKTSQKEYKIQIVAGKSTTGSAKKTDEPKPNVPKPNQSPNPLFSGLKSDILAELESIKRAVTTNKVDEVLGLGYKVGRDGAILRNNNQKKVLPTELETADYEEIISLITQKRDLGRDKNIELNKEIDKKLVDHSDLFYWPITVSKTPNMQSEKNILLLATGKDYSLIGSQEQQVGRDYLKENRNKIRAIIIANTNWQNIGLLADIGREIGSHIPIYTGHPSKLILSYLFPRLRNKIIA